MDELKRFEESYKAVLGKPEFLEEAVGGDRTDIGQCVQHQESLPLCEISAHRKRPGAQWTTDRPDYHGQFLHLPPGSFRPWLIAQSAASRSAAGR